MRDLSASSLLGDRIGYRLIYVGSAVLAVGLYRYYTTIGLVYYGQPLPTEFSCSNPT